MGPMLDIDPWGRLVEYDPHLPVVVGAPPGGPIVPAIPEVYQAGRSGRWPALLKRFLQKYPLCAGCGRKAATAHHEKPVHLFPDLELEESNLIPVCVGCHWVVAHANDWKLYVRDARERLASNKAGVLRAVAEYKERCGEGLP